MIISIFLYYLSAHFVINGSFKEFKVYSCDQMDSSNKFGFELDSFTVVYMSNRLFSLCMMSLQYQNYMYALNGHSLTKN